MPRRRTRQHNGSCVAIHFAAMGMINHTCSTRERDTPSPQAERKCLSTVTKIQSVTSICLSRFGLDQTQPRTDSNLVENDRAEEECEASIFNSHFCSQVIVEESHVQPCLKVVLSTTVRLKNLEPLDQSLDQTCIDVNKEKQNFYEKYRSTK